MGGLALFAGLAGGVWGLALARALAETFPSSPTFDLGPTLLVATLSATVWWLSGRWMASGMVASSTAPLFVPLLLTAIYLPWPRVAPAVGWTLLGGSVVLTLLSRARQAWGTSGTETLTHFKRLIILCLAAVVMGGYLSTLGRTVGQADTFEFQVVAPTLGIAHPTGYPLYILSGKLFSLLPFGSVAWRVNLTSAIFGAAAVVILFQVVYRFTRRALVALISAASLAFSQVYWSQMVVAEVYGLHNLFVAAIIFSLVEAARGRRRVSRPQLGRECYPADQNVTDRRPAPVLIYTLSLLLGLSLANHLTTALLIPVVAMALLLVRPSLHWRQWLAAAALLLLGISFYLYIFVRWPALHDGVWMSLDEFWRYITGQQFGGALRLDAWRTDFVRYQIVGRLLRDPFGWWGLLLGTVGLSWLVVKQWRVALITVLTFLSFSWYALSYYVPDIAVFLLPAHLILAVWLGIGLGVTLNAAKLLALRIARSDRIWVLAEACLISLAALLPLGLLWTNFPVVDKTADQDAYVWGDRVLELPLTPEAAILADSVRIAPLYYLQRIEGRRPDLDIVVLADEVTYRAELEARLASGQTVYLARFLPGLEGLYHLRSLGPLTEVGKDPLLEVPQHDRSMGVRFGARESREDSSSQGGGIELLGVSSPVPGPGGGVGLTLYWRADTTVGELYHVRLRLVDDDGQVWWRDEGQHAANNYYPTLAWRAGEVVPDYHEIPVGLIDSVVSPDYFTVQVGLFRPFRQEGLSADDGEMWYSLMQLDRSFLAGESTPDRALRARFSLPAASSFPGIRWTSGPRDGNLFLVGVDLPDFVAPDEPVELQLHTARATALDRDAQWADALGGTQTALTWTDRQGREIEAPILETWGWFRMQVQAPSLPGEYDLGLSLIDQQGRFVTARCGWIARPTQGCQLGRVNVVSASAAALGNFDGRMLLEDVEFGPRSVPDEPALRLSPGEILELTLGWKGLRPMEENYTISVQLVGPDGRLYGQTDTWPVQGTLPTSQWPSGRRISDPYQVMLAPDALPGRYRVGIVVYLLETQTRLPLVEPSGMPIGDIAWVAELEVE